MNLESQTVDELRAAGYAVVVFNPDELRGVAPRRIEDRMIECGNDAIDILVEPEDPRPETDVLANLRALRDAVANEKEDLFDLSAWIDQSPCGTLHCIGGLAPTLPYFRQLGLRAEADGAPYLPGWDLDETLNILFEPWPGAIVIGGDENDEHGLADEVAFSHIFCGYNDGEWDMELRDAYQNQKLDGSATMTHKDLALARLDRAIKNWEAK